MALASGARAQVFDFEKSHPQTISLDGLWRFQPGDDPNGRLGWADPAFNDSTWPLLRGDRPWSEQGFKGSDFGWYRFKVSLPEKHNALGICIPRIHSSYQIFADGKLIEQFGDMPPRHGYLTDFDHIVPLVPAETNSPRMLTIAVRVRQIGWFDRVGGPGGVAKFGEMDALQDLKTQDDRTRFWSLTSSNALMLMNLLAALAGFFLFWMRPGDREYLWFGLYELLTGVEHLCTDWPMFYPTQWIGYWLFDSCRQLSIAQAAQTFGQEDDITVLTLSRLSQQTQPMTAQPLAAVLPS